MTLDELWEAYENKDQDFAGDVYDFMATDVPFKDITKDTFIRDYKTFLPEFDYTGMELAERKRDIDYKEARNLLDTSIDATNRVYATEMDTLSAGYGSEASKARSMAGRTGLRTGTLDEALEDSYEKTANKAKNLGERLDIAQDEAGDKYNIAMVDSALSYDDALHDEKKEFYNRTLAAIARLDAKGVWDKEEPPPPICEEGETLCDDGVCRADCTVKLQDQPPGNEGIADEAYCTDICVPYAGMQGGGMTCYQSCLGTPTLGDGKFDPHVFEQKSRSEANTSCPSGQAEWVIDHWECTGGNDVYDPCLGVIGCAFNLYSGNCIDVHGNACDCSCS